MFAMIIGIGTDLIEIKRIENVLKKFPERFRTRVFTASEQAYAQSSAARYAKRFAAKEAVLKALGTGLSQGFTWHDIEVFNNEQGQPIIHIHKKIKDYLHQKFGQHNFHFHVSLTDTATLAQAFVVISREPCI